MSPRIVVTGGDGFIGRNLRVRLGERGYDDVANVTRKTSTQELRSIVSRADFVYHLAGVNRPQDPAEFTTGNANVTADLCTLMSDGARPPIVMASSTQAVLDNPYGRSKLSAERSVEQYAAEGGRAFIFRLANVFGKWCRPNYNSVIATFCHNLTRALPIVVNDPAAKLDLMYIDDVLDAMIDLVESNGTGADFVAVEPTYLTTVGDVAEILRSFVKTRQSLAVPPAGAGFHRALYATYLSYTPPDLFSYSVPRHADPRGVFVEMVKTHDSGQVSYFTAPAGITRGGHYHHTKTEKFLVVKGTARFRFRNIVTSETRDLVVDADAARVVETVPGWAHDITNIGKEEIIVLLWANEIFDPKRPDTFTARVG